MLTVKEVLTPGDKIHKLRAKYRLTLDEVAYPMTHANLSIIENSKKKLSKNALQIISANLAKHITDLSVEQIAEYLSEEDIKQVNRITKLFTEELSFLDDSKDDKGFDLKVDEFNAFLNKNAPDGHELGEAYTVIVNKYKRVKRYKEAYRYATHCRDAWNCALKHDKVIEITGTMCGLNVSLKRNEVAITIYEYALDIAARFNLLYDRCMYTVYYNVALAYNQLELYNESCECLQILSKYFGLEEKDKNKVLLLRGNCLIYKKDYIAAEKYFKEIYHELAVKGSQEIKTKLYNSLAQLYYDTERYIEAEEYINKALGMKYTIEDNALKSTFYYAVMISVKLKKMFKINEYIHRALDLHEKLKDYPQEMKMMHAVVDYYIDENLFDKLEILIRYIEQKVLKCDYENHRILEIFTKTIAYFQVRDSSKSQEIQKKNLNIIKMFNL